MLLCRDIVTYSRVEESSSSTDSPKTNEENDDELDEQFEQSLAVFGLNCTKDKGRANEETKESAQKLQKPRRKSVMTMVTFSVTAWENFRRKAIKKKRIDRSVGSNGEKSNLTAATHDSIHEKLHAGHAVKR